MYIKIVCTELCGNNIKIYLVQEDGSELDISSCVLSVEWKCSADVAKPIVTLNVLPGEAKLLGRLKDTLG